MKRKRNYRKIVIRVLLIFLVIILILPLISFAIPSGLNPAKTHAFFAEKQLNYKDTIIMAEDRPMRFVCAGNDSLPMVLFIHGSPGSWDAFKDYLTDTGLLAKAFLVAVDRPGYGESGKVGESTLLGQVKYISMALGLRKNNHSVTLVGHSYGGPVAIKLAMQYPDIIQQVILISPTISPEIEEAIKWKRRLQKMSNWVIWHWAISRDLKNSTKEMQPLPDELRLMEKNYPYFKIPILEIHGTKDPLAPIGNQQYVQRVFNNTLVDTITLTGKNHFIPWTMTDKMIAIIKGRL